jgi:hypothetical protein
MKVVKEKGQSTWKARKLTMHGSTAERRLMVLNGNSNRATEKPGNTYVNGNDNKRSRGSKGPR